MCDPISAVVGSAAIGAVSSAVQGSKARKAQRLAQEENERIAARQAQRAEEQFNRANQREPGVGAMFEQNRRRNQGGIGSTFLTGPSGVNARTLPLGGVSLLGS